MVHKQYVLVSALVCGPWLCDTSLEFRNPRWNGKCGASGRNLEIYSKEVW